MTGIDPKDACTVIDISVEDQFAAPGQGPRQVVVVRLLRQLRRRIDLLPEGTRVRAINFTGPRPRHGMACEFVVLAATYTRYDATRIAAELGTKLRAGQLVRFSVVRALMHSVRLPAVKETTEFEEVSPCRAEIA
jgi:hypothetical protein